jgi:hypothetical protein
MRIKIGDLVKYTGGDAELGVGIVTEKRKHGGYWAYFADYGDYFPITYDYDDWELICR